MPNSLENFDPTPPDLNPEDYSSPLLTAFTDQLYDTLVNGGTGLSPEVQAAEMALNQQRIDRETEKLLDRASTQYEAMGWTMPPGALAALRQEAINEAARIAADNSNKILVQTFDLAQKNTFHNLDLIRDTLNNLMQYKVTWLTAIVREYEAEISYVDAIIRKELGIAQIKGEWNKDQVALYQADIQNLSAAYGAIMQGYETESRTNIAQATTDLETEKEEYQGAIAMFGVYKQVLDSAAKIAAQLCASWVGSVSASEQVSYNEQRSDRRGLDVSHRTSESVSWDNNYTYDMNE